MKLPNRTFDARPARRERVPLLIGLTGPSGGGKTFSALRLATGIRQVTGGDIYFIDTEARRALHYADRFDFKHVPFSAPFGSLDYLAALQFCVGEGAGVVIVDSLSHEHEGPGGMVDLQEQIVQRMAGDDYAKRERVKMLAWAEPKAKRRQLINGILQLNCNFIFCFRAKNVSKPVKNAQGKTEVQQMGYMPIAGEEFVFEQTLNALLLPGAGGVPTWFPDERGERTMVKLPEQFKGLSQRQKPLDETVGKHLALWARGEAPPDRIDEGVDTLTHDNPTAAEGRGDSNMGESLGADEHNLLGDETPAWRAVVDEYLDRLTKVETLIDVKGAINQFAETKRALPDDVIADIEAAEHNAQMRFVPATGG